jgi:hypothetical protein
LGFFQFRVEKWLIREGYMRGYKAVEESKTESQITIEFSEMGIHCIKIGADDAEALAAAYRLLSRVAKELRALDKELRRPAPGGSGGGLN